MRWLKELWGRWTTSKEVALLQAENQRLWDTNGVLQAELEQSRKETRAAVNTLLGQAGIAPLPPSEEVKPPAKRFRRLTFQQRQRIHALATVPKREEKQDGRIGRGSEQVREERKLG